MISNSFSRNYFIIPDETAFAQDPILGRIFVENKPEWVCWQTGLELRYLETTLFSMKQVLPKIPSANLFDYHGMKIVLNQGTLEDGAAVGGNAGGGGGWTDLECHSSSILEVSLPQGMTLQMSYKITSFSQITTPT